MCVSVEMLWRCRAEKFIVDGQVHKGTAKMRVPAGLSVFEFRVVPLASTSLYRNKSRR
jgi:hypothetical protein